MSVPRFLTIAIPALGPELAPEGAKPLTLIHFSGRDALCSTYRFELKILSDNPEILADDVLGLAACVTIDGQSEAPQYYHGIITMWGQTHHDPLTGVTSYQARLDSNFKYECHMDHGRNGQ